MLKKIVFFFVVIVFIANASCKKYPDGPWLSIHLKKERIAGKHSKDWTVDSYLVNDIDSSSSFKSTQLFGVYSFSRSNDFLGGEGGFVFKSKNQTTISGGRWDLANNKANLWISQDYALNYNPLVGKNVSWEVMRLTEKDLWVKTTYNGKEYFVKFIN